MPATLPLLLLLATANVFTQLDNLLLPLGILTLHFCLLDALYRQPLTVEHMRNYLGIHQSDCGVLLLELSEHGYIASGWRNDRLYWHLTSSGRALRAAARELVGEKVLEVVPEGLPTQLKRELGQLAPPPPKLPPARVKLAPRKAEKN